MQWDWLRSLPGACAARGSSSNCVRPESGSLGLHAVSADHMRTFWDARAREDAYFFVDNRRGYGDPELQSFWTEGEQDLDRILEMFGAEVRSTDTVLDIGCGVGRLTRPLAARAAQVYGIDISAEMLDRARVHHSDLTNVHWLHGDGRSLQPVADASIDACVSHVVFQHIPDPSITIGYFREMGRVLKGGGWAAFQVSNLAAAHKRRRGARARFDRLRSLIGRTPGGQEDPAWLGSAVDLDELCAAGLGAGLAIQRVSGKGTLFCLVFAKCVAS
jgi:SAM-dependent methyltransferase